MLTAERLKRMLEYDPFTGVFCWKVDRTSIKAGQRAGRLNTGGYCQISIDGRRYKAAALAWLYMTGQWPQHQMDHINRNSSDDRWSNLRDVTPSQNNMNRKCQNDLCAGVTKRRDKFIAQIQFEGKKRYLGTFKTVEEASLAYQHARNAFNIP